MASLFGAFPDYRMLDTDEPEHFDETYRRAIAVAEAFDLKNLQPTMLIKFYIFAAQGYAMLGNTNKALEILVKYTKLVTGDIYPLRLKGEGYFNLIEEWFEELDLGTALPRDEKIVRQSMYDSVINNPVFTTLTDECRFRMIMEKLKNKLTGGAV